MLLWYLGREGHELPSALFYRKWSGEHFLKIDWFGRRPVGNVADSGKSRAGHAPTMVDQTGLWRRVATPGPRTVRTRPDRPPGHQLSGRCVFGGVTLRGNDAWSG